MARAPARRPSRTPRPRRSAAVRATHVKPPSRPHPRASEIQRRRHHLDPRPDLRPARHTAAPGVRISPSRTPAATRSARRPPGRRDLRGPVARYRGRQPRQDVRRRPRRGDPPRGSRADQPRRRRATTSRSTSTTTSRSRSRSVRDPNSDRQAHPGASSSSSAASSSACCSRWRPRPVDHLRYHRADELLPRRADHLRRDHRLRRRRAARRDPDRWPQPDRRHRGPVAFLASGAFGWANDAALWRPLRRRGTGVIAMMIVSIGLSIFLRNVYQYFSGAQSRNYSQYAAVRPWEIGPILITPRDLVVVSAAMIAAVATTSLLQSTRLGKATRAVSDNPALAASTGINVERNDLPVWIAGTALAGLAGGLLGLTQGSDYQVGFKILLLVSPPSCSVASARSGERSSERSSSASSSSLRLGRPGRAQVRRRPGRAHHRAAHQTTGTAGQGPAGRSGTHGHRRDPHPLAPAGARAHRGDVRTRGDRPERAPSSTPDC